MNNISKRAHSMKRFSIVFIFLALILAGSAISWRYYHIIYGKNVPTLLDEEHLLIPTGTNYDTLLHILDKEGFLIDKHSFDKVAAWMKFKKDYMPPGRFRIIGGWSNRQLIQHLRSGNQDPVAVTFNNVRNVEDLAGKISDYIEPDSFEFINYLTNEPFLRSIGYSKETALCLFIPNTYELYWNTSMESLIHRMKIENEKFWAQNNRTAKADALGLSKNEIYTLASIVEKETLVSSEKRRIAGVYLNRLSRGIRLQADPTVVFAIGDFTIRRVLNKHLEFDSPFNTYLYTGLPPGPICMPEIETIDAVLTPEKHNYLYFCAEPGYAGAHAFAETLVGHLQNARKYQRWLNQQNIK